MRHVSIFGQEIKVDRTFWFRHSFFTTAFNCVSAFFCVAVATTVTASAATCTANDFQCQQREQAEQRHAQEKKAEQQDREQAERQVQQQQQARLLELREQQQREQQQREQQQREQQLREQQQRELQQLEQKQRAIHDPIPRRSPELSLPQRQPPMQPPMQPPTQPRAQPPAQPQFQPEPGTPEPNSYRPTLTSPAHATPSLSLQKPSGMVDLHTSLEQMNAARSNYAGINRQPIPVGITQPIGHGGLKVATPDGRQLLFRSSGTLASVSAGGTTATLFSNGQIRSLHTDNLQINRTTGGVRSVVLQLPNQTTVFSTGKQRGYVDSQTVWQGRVVTQRTFFNHGRTYTRLYGSASYHGVILVFYIPIVVYNPYYYGWAYYPWANPVYFNWGWSNAPWYQANSGYFMNSAYYETPSMWITDKMMGSMMQSNYDDQYLPNQIALDPSAINAGPDDIVPDPIYAGNDTPVSPELKLAIADQIGQQVLLDNAAAQSPLNAASLTGLPRALQPNHLFIVSQPLQVSGGTNQTCGLTPGDVLQLLATPAQNAISADLSVDASRRGDCPTGINVTIMLTDLQEMQNEFSYQVDRGLQSLNALQGQQGLPTAPAQAYNPSPKIGILPAPDPNVATLIEDAQLQADEDETQLIRTAFSN